MTVFREKFRGWMLVPSSLPVHKPYMDVVDMKLTLVHFGKRQKRQIPFLLSLLIENPPFAVLTRYYILNSVTGSHHLFQFRQKKHVRDKWFPLSDAQPNCSRTDMKAYFMWYVDFAYEKLGLPLPDESNLRAFDILQVMSEFWNVSCGPQDSIAICLEIQQRFLYLYFRDKFRLIIAFLKM